MRVIIKVQWAWNGWHVTTHDGFRMHLPFAISVSDGGSEFKGVTGLHLFIGPLCAHLLIGTGGRPA